MYFDNFEFYYICEMTPVRDCFDDKSKYNQVANFTYLDTGVNIAIGKKAPNVYFNKALEQCSTGQLEVGTIVDYDKFWANLEANCIPKEILDMTAADYPEFLKMRRLLMAQKIKKYYYSL